MKQVISTLSGKTFGTFDGEYIYNKSGAMCYRVDGDEVYNMEIPCKYVGSYENGKITWIIDPAPIIQIAD